MLWYGGEAGVWWFLVVVARLMFVVTGVWIGAVCGGEASVCCDWCLDWGCDLIFSVRDERDIFCAWVMGLQL